MPVPDRRRHLAALCIGPLGRVERVELATHPRAAQPRPDGVRRRELRAADLEQRIEHVERFLEPHLVLEVMGIREQGREHQPGALLPEGVRRAAHQAQQVARLGRAGRELAAAARGGDVLIVESVRMQGGVLGAEQVHQAEDDEGGLAGPIRHALQEDGVRQAGVL